MAQDSEQSIPDILARIGVAPYDGQRNRRGRMGDFDVGERLKFLRIAAATVVGMYGTRPPNAYNPRSFGGAGA